MFETNDTFVEEAVKVIETAQDKTKKTAASVITLILLVSLVTYSRGFLTIIMAILLIAMAIYTIILYTNKNIEYEYDYTNGSLEIAKIINNEKRKKVVNIESNEVKMVAAVGTNESLKYDHVQLKTYDCSAHDSEQKDYILVAHSEAKGNDFKVIFTPSDKLLNAMAKYNKHDIYL
ncbi:MAG: hypothetical protein IJJ59_08320 [Pseudobutyrivibrio sp.]|uniref:DUF6106 family protein n=1 Tax=Pseudobutyrivibrio sp. TaxID=2014367 RepID=UPI0025FF4E0E|nr:DUF6106 family protein [Pseudobutyrivibrio sp.]MBQ6463313.1 hypothetical protein [Pseudobutyrivibrio sp.]